MATTVPWLVCLARSLPSIGILILGALATTAAIGYWLSLEHQEQGYRYAGLASLVYLMFSIPALILPHRLTAPGWKANSVLLGMAIRVSGLCFMLVQFSGKEKEAILISFALVACYFPLLVLESSLLVRQAAGQARRRP